MKFFNPVIGQVAPTSMIDPIGMMNQEDSVEALTLAAKSLRWQCVDDTVMGGKSHTHLIDAYSKEHKLDIFKARKKMRRPQKLYFEGTIDTTARIGFASIRAKLPKPLVSENNRMPQALSITARGDGLTYKVLLMDDYHGRWGRSFNSPLWETDMPTLAGQTKTQQELGSRQTWKLPLAGFIPTYMGRPAEDMDRFQLKPSQITRIGFMLSSRLSDGSPNPSYATQPKIFDFCLEVHDIQVVPDDQFDPNSIVEEEEEEEEEENE